MSIEIGTETASLLSEDEERLMAAARRLCAELIGPQATDTDLADGPPAGNIRALAEAGLLGLNVPHEYGGLGVSGRTLRLYTELLASHCGLTTFVQGQHQSACALINGGDNPELKRALLPLLATGKAFYGVGFGHLRRPGPPVLRAERVEGGYTFTGTAPWVSSWPLLDGAVIGATLPDDSAVFAAISFDALKPNAQGATRDAPTGSTPRAQQATPLQVSPPMPLCAMNASGTVEVSFDGLFVSEARRVSLATRERMQQNDVRAIAGACAQPLGLIRACLNLLRARAEKVGSAEIAAAADALETELNAVRTQAFLWMDNTGSAEYKENALAARGWCIELGVRAAHLAVTAHSGASNSLRHPAQRLYREALFYTLTAQTQDVMRATLGRLRRKDKG